MKPEILILANQRKENYIKAIEKCGAIATVKYLPDLNVNYDGLLLCGGNDIHPSFYGEEIDGAFGFDMERDETEMALLKKFIDTGKPILGICRGHQLLNVALGGTLIQDLEQQSEHTQINGKDSVHQIITKKDSILNTLYGEEVAVNSSHHQGIDKLGKGLLVTALCNGVIEGVEHKTKPYFGVQFHPERMCLDFESEKTVNGIEIFKCFVELCRSK